LANTVDMAFLDASESWEERGELVVYGYIEFAWIRACVKAGLPDDPDYPDQQKWKPKKNGNCMLNALQSWTIAYQCVFSSRCIILW